MWMAFKVQSTGEGGASAPYEPAEDAATLCQPLGRQLKTYFDGLTTGPVPDCLLRLTDQLEAALERGDLRCGGRAPKTR